MADKGDQAAAKSAAPKSANGKNEKGNNAKKVEELVRAVDLLREWLLACFWHHDVLAYANLQSEEDLKLKEELDLLVEVLKVRLGLPI